MLLKLQCGQLDIPWCIKTVGSDLIDNSSALLCFSLQLFEGKSEGKCLNSSVNGMCPAYRVTLLIKFLEINDLSKVLVDGDIQG